MSDKDKKDYSATLQLPKTSFSMRANLLSMEPQQQDRWKRIGLAERSQSKEGHAGPYLFHDGPPYANGPIHMGHLLNKILKDLVVRSRLMSGYGVKYVPGWDCHGLPIEHKVLKELGPKGRELETLQIRERCQRYASKFVSLQSEQMQRLGTLADYENPYLTMDKGYEGAVLEVFAALVAEGLVYRDVKPVHWSIANQTALAEAELEYYEKTDTSVFVEFEIEDPGRLPESLRLAEADSVSLMIWTTTPWTLPANLAVAVSPRAEYAAYRLKCRGKFSYCIVAEELASRVLGLGDVEELSLLGRCRGEALVDSGIRYHHPFVDRQGLVLAADYVTLEDGTGLVHTAPGHGAEDYFTGIQAGLPIYCPVLSDGTFDDSVPDWLVGQDVWTANGIIVEKLRESGHLFHDHEYVHSYPHDWRSKTPTIFRATEQWFIAVDKPFGSEQKSLRARALQASAGEIEFVPGWGKSRMEGMLEARPDWCISRQRAWGLPIPAFHTEDGKVLLTEASVRAVGSVVRQEGSDYWFIADSNELLKLYDPGQDPDAPSWLLDGSCKIGDLSRGEDIFDVWFESGSSWNGVLRERGMGYPADLYLEGSDQHRGWFQLSLLPGLGVTGRSPFKTVLTHGFMVDADGRKMSKSVGNALEVQDVLKVHGADICRWWVSSLNYTNDIKVDWEFFKVAGDEYRKVRNTIRFLLGNLADFDPARDRHDFTEEDRESIDGWALEQLAHFLETVKRGYLKFNFKQVSELIFDFCNDSMSAVYLAAVKDRLYCDSAGSPRRKRTQTVLYEIADGLIRAIAPILVHTAEEAWLALNGLDTDSDQSVHLQVLLDRPDWKADPAWQTAMEVRAQVMKRLEAARTGENPIKNSLDTGIRATVPSGLWAELEPFLSDLPDLFGVSRLELVPGSELSVEVLDLRGEPRCERSWKRDVTVRRRTDGGLLSDRDAAVVGV